MTKSDIEEIYALIEEWEKKEPASGDEYDAGVVRGYDNAALELKELLAKQLKLYS